MRFNIWDSPTVTTWLAIIMRALGVAGVMPLILVHFSSEEILVWQLLISFIGLQALAEFGMTPTMTRLIAYQISAIQEKEKTSEKLVVKLYETLQACKIIFIIISFIYFLVAGLFCTAALIRPISNMGQNGVEGWVAWGITLVSTAILIYGFVYASILQGSNYIAIYRRWQSIFSLFAVMSGIIVVICGGKLISVMVASQLWSISNVIFNKYLVDKLIYKKYNCTKKCKITVNNLKTIWKPGWRSGIGIAAQFGVIQISGIIGAQFLTIEKASMYLLGLRLIRFSGNLSQVPFYSKIPTMAQEFAKNNISEIISIYKATYNKVLYLFSVLFFILYIYGSDILDYIGSNVPFPDNNLWIFLGFGFYLEKIGGIHMQLYSVTNDILWHIYNGVTGSIIIIFSIPLVIIYNELGFAMAIVIGNLIFYMPITVLKCCKYFNLNIKTVYADSFMPLIIIALLCLCMNW
jgi:hypothetical protein